MELIEREAALTVIEQAAAWGQGHNAIYDDMRDIPSVDAAQVVHGRWIKVGADKYCSCCSAWKPKIKHHITNETIEPICCPSCGAKMDGGEDDADN